MATTTAAPPTYDDGEVVVPAPGPGAGNWAGAASAVLVDGGLLAHLAGPGGRGSTVAEPVLRLLGVGHEDVQRVRDLVPLGFTPHASAPDT